MLHKSRAYRRHQMARIKDRVQRYRSVALSARDRVYGLSPPDGRRIGMVAATHHPCSCWACGNPRRWWGTPTAQERRHMAQDAAGETGE